MNYRWSCAPPQEGVASALSKKLGISSLLAQCLLNRGQIEPDVIERFLSPRLQNLANPCLIPNMRLAVQRLITARESRESVVIFGDYDVDGVSAATVLLEVLRALGWAVECYLPHRMDEGYGLSQAGMENCLRKYPTRLILAVDCGSTSQATILWLRDQGVDVLVLDHHQVSDPPPGATALVNPQLAGPAEPSFRELASVGLAFKLAHALVREGRRLGWPGATELDLRCLLDLVALGTIADLVPLTGENRILVNAGLQRLCVTTRPGLVALKAVAQVREPVAGYEVGFLLAPRLNAAGRLENAAQALDLLLAKNALDAQPLAEGLDLCNRERQRIQQAIGQEAVAAVRARFDPGRDYVIIEGQSHWHIGVVGIVASRVLKEFHRPTIILGGDGAEWRGSGRSIEGFDLASALRECDDLLLRHGGHAMAAGVSVLPGKTDAFRERLNDIARRSLTPDRLQPVLRLDAPVTAAEMNLAQVRDLQRLQQTGTGNPPVHLFIKRVSHHKILQRMGQDRRHAKFWITDRTGICEAVWWRAGDTPMPAGEFDLAFSPQVNQFNGHETVQLSVLDWRPACEDS